MSMNEIYYGLLMVLCMILTIDKCYEIYLLIANKKITLIKLLGDLFKLFMLFLVQILFDQLRMGSDWDKPYIIRLDLLFNNDLANDLTLTLKVLFTFCLLGVVLYVIVKSMVRITLYIFVWKSRAENIQKMVELLFMSLLVTLYSAVFFGPHDIDNSVKNIRNDFISFYSDVQEERMEKATRYEGVITDKYYCVGCDKEEYPVFTGPIPRSYSIDRNLYLIRIDNMVFHVMKGQYDNLEIGNYVSVIYDQNHVLDIKRIE